MPKDDDFTPRNLEMASKPGSQLPCQNAQMGSGKWVTRNLMLFFLMVLFAFTLLLLCVLTFYWKYKALRPSVRASARAGILKWPKMKKKNGNW